MLVKDNKEALCRIIDEKRAEFISISHELYRNPEVGLKEFKASALISGILEDEGYEINSAVAGMETAFTATFGYGAPCIAILAEMDALPEMGHACGHNIIAAAATGAAVALKKVIPEDAARIMLIATPAEELGIGKIELINAGCFSGVDFAMMVHPSSRRYVTKAYLGLARLKFIFHGKAAHAAAYPEEGLNALDAVLQTFNAINALRQQLHQDTRVHGIINEGGVAPNIIPEKASCSFYVRSPDSDDLKHLTERVIACAEGAAMSSGCRLELERDPRVLAPFRINSAFAELYASQLKILGLEADVVPVDRNRGSSDIGNVSQIVPTIHPHVPIGSGINIHSSSFADATISQQGDEAVLEGAKCLAMTAYELISNEAARKKVCLG